MTGDSCEGVDGRLQLWYLRWTTTRLRPPPQQFQHFALSGDSSCPCERSIWQLETDCSNHLSNSAIFEGVWPKWHSSSALNSSSLRCKKRDPMEALESWECGREWVRECSLAIASVQCTHMHTISCVQTCARAREGVCVCTRCVKKILKSQGMSTYRQRWRAWPAPKTQIWNASKWLVS